MENNTSKELSFHFGKESSSITTQDIIFAALYAGIVIPGVIGNGMVITIVRKTPSMHTTTNYLLLNLALADLLTLLLCPGLYDFALTKVRLEGFSGDLVCKLFAGNAVVPITINVAVLTVCTISVERYLALLRPFQSTLRISEDKVKYAIVALWFLAFLSCIPDIQANTFDITSSKYPCKRPWSLDEYFLHKPFIIFTCVGFGIVSSLILFICHFEIVRGLYFAKTILSESTITEAERRAKKQLARLLIWLAFVFAVCSLPFSFYFVFLISADFRTVQKNYEILFSLHRLSRFLLFSNSFFNPILYALQSSNFREGFNSIFNLGLLGCKPCANNRNSVRNVSLTAFTQAEVAENYALETNVDVVAGVETND